MNQNYLDFAKGLKGLTEEEAIKLLKHNKVNYIFYKKDGRDTSYERNQDLRSDRIMLEVENGIVIKAFVS